MVLLDYSTGSRTAFASKFCKTSDLVRNHWEYHINTVLITPHFRHCSPMKEAPLNIYMRQIGAAIRALHFTVVWRTRVLYSWCLADPVFHVLLICQTQLGNGGSLVIYQIYRVQQHDLSRQRGCVSKLTQLQPPETYISKAAIFIELLRDRLWYLDLYLPNKSNFLKHECITCSVGTTHQIGNK